MTDTSRQPPTTQPTSTTPTTTTKSAPYPTIILFGDSITEALDSPPTFSLPLRSSYARRADILNRGFGGYTTRLALDVLPKFFPVRHGHQHEHQHSHSNPRESGSGYGTAGRSEVKLMTIFFGANDACVPGEAQHVPLDEYGENLKKLVTMVRGSSSKTTERTGEDDHGTKVILITPGPVDEWSLNFAPLPAVATKTASTDGGEDASKHGPSRRAEVTRRYAAMCLRVGKELGVPVIDLWGRFMREAGYERGAEDESESERAIPGSRRAERNNVLGRLLPDGLHFSDAAYALWRDELVSAIAKHYPDLTPERMPFVFEAWDTLLGVQR